MDSISYELCLKDYLPLWKGEMDAAKWTARREELKGLLKEHCYPAHCSDTRMADSES